MGADGTLYVMKAETFAEQWPGLVPQQCGLSERTLFGVPALTAYTDTSGRDDFEYSIASKANRLAWRRQQLDRLRAEGEGEPGERVIQWKGLPAIREPEVLADIAVLEADPEIDLAQRCADAIEWFEANAESLTVWT